MKKRMKKRIIDYQINKEETTGWEICGQLSCDNCHVSGQISCHPSILPPRYPGSGHTSHLLQ